MNISVGEDPDFETVAGFAIEELKHLPVLGETSPRKAGISKSSISTTAGSTSAGEAGGVTPRIALTDVSKKLTHASTRMFTVEAALIRTFKSKALKELFETALKQGSAVLQKRICLRLDRLEQIERVEDMNLPGFNFHALRVLNQLDTRSISTALVHYV